MARPAGLEPATFGFVDRTPELHELLIVQQLDENRPLARLHVLADFLDFGRFWKVFLTQILTRAGATAFRIHRSFDPPNYVAHPPILSENSAAL